MYGSEKVNGLNSIFNQYKEYYSALQVTSGENYQEMLN